MRRRGDRMGEEGMGRKIEVTTLCHTVLFQVVKLCYVRLGYVVMLLSLSLLLSLHLLVYHTHTEVKLS